MIMSKREKLDMNMYSETFKSYYYLKEELIDFCRKNHLQTTGSKLALIERIAHFLDTGERTCKSHMINKNKIVDITLDKIIEDNFVCSQVHRAFFKEQIGKIFSFNVTFQKWLKTNSGKTYRDAIGAYYQILDDKKKGKTNIDKQFEYNTYIRDFFADNKDKTLNQAIICWKYKKSKKGHNKYERENLEILNS